MFLVLFLTIFIAIVNGQPEEQFIKDIIGNYNLTSPTLILAEEELPELCFDMKWVLCLSTSQHEVSDVAIHLKVLHLNRKQGPNSKETILALILA